MSDFDDVGIGDMNDDEGRDWEVQSWDPKGGKIPEPHLSDRAAPEPAAENPQHERGWVRTHDMMLALARSHRCSGHGDCAQCQMAADVQALVKEVELVNSVRTYDPQPRATPLTVERLAALLKEAGEAVLMDDYSIRGEHERLAAWLLPCLTGEQK